MELPDLKASGHFICETGPGIGEIRLFCMFEICVLKFGLGFGNWQFRA
jgi:hypothetical protein